MRLSLPSRLGPYIAALAFFGSVSAVSTSGVFARNTALIDLKPTIDNGQANQALVRTRRTGDGDWLLFSLKKGSKMLYYGAMWIRPATSAGGIWTDARGDEYSYAADGVYMGDHLQLLPGAVAIDNTRASYTGSLDFNGSEYTFAGKVSLLGDAFSSDNSNPLVFKLVKGVGAVYVSGKGTVTTQDRKKLVFP
jgi:hypothetical protein